jgi:hypothetical protein
MDENLKQVKEEQDIYKIIIFWQEDMGLSRAGYRNKQSVALKCIKCI